MTFKLRWGSRGSQVWEVTGSEGSVFQVYAHRYEPELHDTIELVTDGKRVPHDGSQIAWFKAP
jgi:hypothetical protein